MNEGDDGLLPPGPPMPMNYGMGGGGDEDDEGTRFESMVSDVLSMYDSQVAMRCAMIENEANRLVSQRRLQLAVELSSIPASIKSMKMKEYYKFLAEMRSAPTNGINRGSTPMNTGKAVSEFLVTLKNGSQVNVNSLASYQAMQYLADLAQQVIGEPNTSL
ncbi:hypothetical protein Pelo_6396 [Pelomyxa schiedti]|nr:hypothetical protein Pelo_6396 [Pelomyxa schiedti]